MTENKMTGNKKRIYIYTGNGKGKTTAAVGQDVRAAAAGMKVLFVYFNKVPPLKGGEDKLLSNLTNIKVKHFAQKHPAFFKERTSKKMADETVKGLEFIKDYLRNNGTDLVVLDEIIISLRDNFIKEKKLMKYINDYIRNSEVILTGRGAGPELIKKADLVSEIVNVKHYYSKGEKSREGIEI